MDWSYGYSKRTEVQLITPETVTKLRPVDQKDSPVLCEPMFTNTESNSWGAEDVAKNTVIESFSVSINPFEQRDKCLHRGLGFLQQRLSLNP